MVSPKEAAAIFDRCGFVNVLPIRIGRSDGTYRLRAGIWTRDKGPCLRLKRQFGGSISVASYTNDDEGRRFYRLQLGTAMARRFLRSISKYLKRRKAIVTAALRLDDTVQVVGHRYTIAAIRRRRRLYLHYLAAHKDFNSKVRVWRCKDKKAGVL